MKIEGNVGNVMPIASSTVSTMAAVSMGEGIGTSKWWDVCYDIFTWRDSGNLLGDSIDFKLAHMDVVEDWDPSYEFGIIEIGGGYGVIDWRLGNGGRFANMSVLMVKMAVYCNTTYLKPRVIVEMLKEPLKKEGKLLDMLYIKHSDLVEKIRRKEAGSWWLVAYNLSRNEIKEQKRMAWRIWVLRDNLRFFVDRQGV